MLNNREKKHYSIILIIYFLFWTIFLISNKYIFNSSDKVVLDIFGGIQIATIQAHNILKTIKWYVILLVPICSCLFLIYQECSKFGLYSIIRYTNIYKWWEKQLKAIITIQYLYFSSGIISIHVFCFDELRIQMNRCTILIALIFPLYTLSVSMVCIYIFIITNRVTTSFSGLVVMIGILSNLNFINPLLNRIDFGSFGMIIRSSIYLGKTGFNIIYAVAIMIAIILFINFLIFKHLKENDIKY